MDRMLESWCSHAIELHFDHSEWLSDWASATQVPVFHDEALTFADPKVLPIHLGQALPKTIGFTFPESPQWSSPASKQADDLDKHVSELASKPDKKNVPLELQNQDHVSPSKPPYQATT
jgi:hypothetical protein